jgi:hypothetical protein
MSDTVRDGRILEEIGRVHVHINKLGDDNTNHRANCTPCMSGNPCSSVIQRLDKMDGLMKRVKDLERSIGR